MGFLHWLFGKMNEKATSIEPRQDVIPANQNQDVINQTGCLTFCVGNLQNEFKEFSRLDESVKGSFFTNHLLSLQPGLA